MSKQLEEYCKRENYEKLHAIIAAKTVLPNSAFASLVLTQDDWAMLKEYVEEKATFHLRSSGTIPEKLVEIAPLLGQEYHANLQLIASKYIISKEIAEFAQFYAIHFQDLNNLEEIYKKLEDSIEHISSYYVCHFDMSRIILQYLDYALSMIKQKLCDFFFACPVNQKCYSQGLDATILFEKKLLPFLKERRCCSDNAEQSENCIHCKMLSTTFLPYIDLYFKNIFLPGAEEDVSMATKCGILPEFLCLFQKIESVYNTVVYFDDSEISSQFFNVIYTGLINLTKLIRPSCEIASAACILNTLAYVQETFQELGFKLNDTQNLTTMSDFCAHLARTEQEQIQIVEKEIGTAMRKNLEGALSAEYVKNLYGEMSQELCSYNDDVKRVFSEIINSQIFGVITGTKMGDKKAVLLLQEITDIELYLLQTGWETYHIKSIKEYLKIFACPVDDANGFIANFDLISKDNFSFLQILNAFEDKEQANVLFIKYKQRMCGVAPP